MERPLLQVTNVTVQYADAEHAAVREVSFDVSPGEVVGLTGASGCGKTTAALSVLGLLPPWARLSGSITLAGRELTRLSEREWRDVRGASIAIVFQEPGMALNPVVSVGSQIADIVRAHERCGRAAARDRACEALHEVGLGAGLRQWYRAYPHELSGGQAQRILLAQAIACRPSLIIADEPTASLDAAVRAQILRLVATLRERHRLAFLLISHNAAVLEAAADRVLTMAGGRMVAQAGVSRPRILRRHRDTSREPALAARGVTKHYRRQRLLSWRDASVPAVCEVDLSLPSGATVGLAGESGAGKSTLARCLAGLAPVDAGEIAIGGRDIARLGGRALQPFRREVQLVQQDSASAFNPRFTAEQIVTEPLVIQDDLARTDRPRRARELMALVGLDAERLTSPAAEFSGGERQRLAIARALALRPRVLILDEPVSNLDSANQERIVTLLDALQRQYGLTYLWISHDLGLLASIADRLAVMYGGRIVECGPTSRVLSRPQHSHTRELVA